MAWFGNVSLGGFPDLAGAVSKLSESVKNIEKNFDSALGLEEKHDGSDDGSGKWTSTSGRQGLFEPMMSFMGQKEEENASEQTVLAEFSQHPLTAEEHEMASSVPSSLPISKPTISDKGHEDSITKDTDIISANANTMVEEPQSLDVNKGVEPNDLEAETGTSLSRSKEEEDSSSIFQQKTDGDIQASDNSRPEDPSQPITDSVELTVNNVLKNPEEVHHVLDSQGTDVIQETKAEQPLDKESSEHSEVLFVPENLGKETSVALPVSVEKYDHANEPSYNNVLVAIHTEQDHEMPSDSVTHDTNASPKSLKNSRETDDEHEGAKPLFISSDNALSSVDQPGEIEKVKQEMRMMESALKGAARQAQAKADEIAKLMNENEQLKSVIEDLKRKSKEDEIDALRDEYHQKVSSLERKVYALTRERDTLRREQSKKNDAAALLKEKDEIISQVMAEGEELSKKQAAQEATIRKLRAQIRELEEEKQRLNSKLQVEETKVESMKRDKAATEKLLQETIERNQAELAAQKEFYTNALNAAKEAEALAEERANSEAKVELENRLKEASEREAMLIQTLEELRHSLTRTEQQAAFREEMLRRDMDDLQKRYHDSELRYTEMITQVPESTRPLLRQIEAMQETAARRAEAWAGVEKALNSRLQEAEAKAAAAEEKERTLNERLSQNLSRITVLETQIACIRTEQTQLSKSLEKERQRASESRQEYLAAMEEAATQEGRAKQFEEELKEIRSKHKRELQDEVVHRELLEKELERVGAAKDELEKTVSRESTAIANQNTTKNLSVRNLSSAGSSGSMEESFFLQASLDSSDNPFSERRQSGEATVSPYFLKSMTQSAYEASLRHKDGEVASYISRLASLEAIRDSLAEELVKMTEQCEKLRAEAATLPGLRAELEALRRRHSAALELMGERDEELEELRADIIDLKEMYREQVDLLVDRLQTVKAQEP
ncbi:golgin candidate 5-like isoform X1 [Zingiber officinale]|uniref:golgin candidate 5-like isoform X1 n=1 Tax=Zingiber officinale TaxID=94328 RepID=UPI001C4B90CF|nr:golgin candidate 5-like isoform X1 [Zingiber officinale]